MKNIIESEPLYKFDSEKAKQMITAEEFFLENFGDKPALMAKIIADSDAAITRALLKEMRQEQGITQAELAKRSGVSRDIISQIETGKRNATIRTLDLIAMGMGKKLEIRFV